MFSTFFGSSSKVAVSAALIASRDKAFVTASDELHLAHAAVATARGDLDREKAALATEESELANLPDPGVDKAAAADWNARKAVLAKVIEGYSFRIASAEEKLHAAEDRVASLRKVMVSAMEEIDAKGRDTVADLPRLRSEAAKLRGKADGVVSELSRAQQAAAAAAAAFAALAETGAAADDARRILERYKQTKATFEGLSADHEALESAAVEIETRVSALEELEERARRVAAVEAGLGKLNKQRPSLDATIEVCNHAGVGLASLRRTCDGFADLYRRRVEHLTGEYSPHAEKILMNAPHFAENAVLPIFGSDGYFLLPDHWTHNRSQYEVRNDILSRLNGELQKPDVVFKTVLTEATKAIESEYVGFASAVRECMAVWYAWLAERDGLIKDNNDIARSCVIPAFPLQRPGGGDWAVWRNVSLPSLRANGTPIWDRNWHPQRLLELTKQAVAA